MFPFFWPFRSEFCGGRIMGNPKKEYAGIYETNNPWNAFMKSQNHLTASVPCRRFLVDNAGLAAVTTLLNRLKFSVAKSWCRFGPVGRVEKIRNLGVLSALHLGSDCWRRRSQDVQERRQCGVVGRFTPGHAQRDSSRLWCDLANDHLRM